MDKSTNKAAREEFIFVLNRLVNDQSGKYLSNKSYCDAYKKEKNGFMDYRRVSIILAHIYEMSQNGEIPYKIEVSYSKKGDSENKTPKYRCIRYAMPFDNVIKVGKSIKRDPTLGQKEKERLLAIIRSTCVTPLKYDDFDEEISKAKGLFVGNPGKIHDNFRRAYADKKAVRIGVKIGSNFECYPNELSDKVTNERHNYMVKKIFNEHTPHPKIVLWCITLKCVVIIHNDDIDSEPYIVPTMQDARKNKCDFIEGYKYKKYTEWEEDYFNGFVGKVEDITIRISSLQSNEIEKKNALAIVKDLENYYPKQQKPKAKMSVNGDVITYDISIRSNRESFTNWFKNHVLDVQIISPLDLEEEILGQVVGRYNKKHAKEKGVRE